MSRASQAANGVAKAVEQYADLYRIPKFRMQSRVFEVTGEGGNKRPMFMGEWTDSLGQKHRSGMADYLLTPRVVFLGGIHATLALWVECKSGTGRLTPKQVLFRNYILEQGGYYQLIHDNPEILPAWFEQLGVVRP